MQTETPSRPSRAAYQAQRRAQSVTLYFRSPEDLQHHQDQARAAGYAHNFNAWLLQMVANGTSGSMYPPEYVTGLEKELERVRGWLESARDENTAQRDELRALRSQREALLACVTEADPQQAARFLKQQGAGA